MVVYFLVLLDTFGDFLVLLCMFEYFLVLFGIWLSVATLGIGWEIQCLPYAEVPICVYLVKIRLVYIWKNCFYPNNAPEAENSDREEKIYLVLDFPPT